MAGWLVVWNSPGVPLEGARWSASLAVIAELGLHVHEYLAGDIALAAWARRTGEFPHSGRLFRPDPQTRAAWVGQCLEDEGDASAAAVQQLSNLHVDVPAAAGLNGQFALAVVHAAPRRVTLWTDRHAHYPVYLLRSGATRAAATDLQCLAPWLEMPRFDRGAVDLFLRVGELVGRRSLLAGVEVLPGGTCRQEEPGAVREHCYWRLRFEPDETLLPAVVADDLARRLTAAVQRVENFTPRLGIPLSGGLDSRLLLGLCQYPADVPSFTWGRQGCRDVRYAAAFARRVGAPHTVRYWEPAAFPPLWSSGVGLTAGAMGVHEMFMLPFVDLLASHCDVVLNGLAGDVLLGGNFLKRSWLHADSAGALAACTWSWRVPPHVDAWVDRLAPDAGRAGRSLWTNSLAERADGEPVAGLHAWLLENRIFRYTNCGTLLLRGGVESHAPFFDRDVMDLLVRVPLGWKLKHRLYLQTLARACPRAARVRWQRTGLPPAWGFWPNLAAMGVQRITRQALRPLHLDPFAAQAVADPAGWLRGPWRSTVEELLLSPQSLDRGLVEPDALRAVWAAHLRGAELTRIIGVLITLELFARQMLDANLPGVLDDAWIVSAH